MIIEQILKHKAQSAKIFPVRTNRASELGHPCLRYLVFLRTRWQEMVVPPPELLLVFDLGHDLERRVVRDLEEAGFTVIEQQRTFEWPEFQISGRIDCKILINGSTYPCEIKTLAPHLFSKIKDKDVEALKKSNNLFLRKYPAQLSLYLLMDNKERGLFIFKNRATGKMEEIWLDLDYEYAETLLKKAETINRCVASGEVPDPIEFDDDICGQCGFLHICGVEAKRKELDIINDPDLELLISRWVSLKRHVEEFKMIDETLKERLEGKRGICGEFLVDGYWRSYTVYDVPHEVKKPYARREQYWVRKIIRLDSLKGGNHDHEDSQ